MDVNLVQPLNVEALILITKGGRVMEVKPVHLAKADSPMLVTEDGISMEVKPEQRLKAISPITDSVGGSEMEVKRVQPKKAPTLMATTVYVLLESTTVDGMVISPAYNPSFGSITHTLSESITA